MKIPSSVVWQLTKKYNSYLVKFNGQTFSHDPLNLTNLHNASSAGISKDQAVGIHATKVKAKKASRPSFTLLTKHKSHNKITKRKKNSNSGLVYATNPLRRGVNRIAKTIKALPLHSERQKKLALKRVQRLHVATRLHVKKAAAKKDEKK